MKLTLNKPDNIGVLASSLCLIHCIITPFIFIAQSCTASCCDASPVWWQWIDYVFLVISFFAVYRSTQTTSKSIMKPLLWISWFIFFISILNERLNLFMAPQMFMNIAAINLVILHLYNLKFCQCKNDKCCSNNEWRKS